MPWFDDFYHIVEKVHGTRKTQLVADSYKKAVDWIDQTVEEENIECNFSRVDGYLFPHDDSKQAHDSLQNVKALSPHLFSTPSFAPAFPFFQLLLYSASASRYDSLHAFLLMTRTGSYPLYIYWNTLDKRGFFLGYAMYSIPEIQEESINGFLPQCNELLNFRVLT